MTLQLLPLELEDFEAIISHATIYPPGDDLTAPPNALCCPVTTPSEAEARLRFHFTKQRDRFLNDPTVRYMKVVDTSSSTTSPKPAIISIARWHFYPNGFDYTTQAHWELHAPFTSTHQPNLAPIPKDFNIALYNHLFTVRDKSRLLYMAPNAPCWVLMHMVTHPSYRGRGAAGMLVRWGMGMAEKDQVPAYLEAGVMGRPVYEKLGFKQVGDVMEEDISAFGMANGFVFCNMAYVPKAKTVSEAVAGIA